MRFGVSLVKTEFGVAVLSPLRPRIAAEIAAERKLSFPPSVS
jgi:hypothetical protein